MGLCHKCKSVDEVWKTFPWVHCHHDDEKELREAEKEVEELKVALEKTRSNHRKEVYRLISLTEKISEIMELCKRKDN